MSLISKEVRLDCEKVDYIYQVLDRKHRISIAKLSVLIEELRKLVKKLNLLHGFYMLNPHMHEIFLQLYCMKWISRDRRKEMLN